MNFWRALLLLLGSFSWAAWVAIGSSPTFVQPELLGIVPPTAGLVPADVDCLRIPQADPSRIIFITRNVGAQCGGGTPAGAWKLTMDPSTGAPLTVELRQVLTSIQTGRASLFEAADGTLFTGGGWCGPKPPHVSVDLGDSWRPANNGESPPNSTFCFGEFNGTVYAGTGYEPYHGQIYRWLGGPVNDWQLVFDIAPPRSIVTAITAHQGRLFVGSSVYWWNGQNLCEGSVPVYASTDGLNFQPTTGIPSCYSIDLNALLTVNGTLLAQARNPQGIACGYRWDPALNQWVLHSALGTWPTSISGPTAVGGDTLYLSGQRPNQPAGVYASRDLGLSWQLVFPWPGPAIWSLTHSRGSLYFGTVQDSSGQVAIYRARLEIPVIFDLKPGSCSNPLNPSSRGVTPALILGTPDFDVAMVDVTSLRLEGSVAPRHGSVADAGTPGRPGDVPCPGERPDGYPDLVLKFPTRDLVAALGSLPAGSERVVHLSGRLLNGTPLTGKDIVTVVGRPVDK